MEGFRSALEEAGTVHEVVVYPGAPHSFFDRHYEQYADDSADAWRRIHGVRRCANTPGKVARTEGTGPYGCERVGKAGARSDELQSRPPGSPSTTGTTAGHRGPGPGGSRWGRSTGSSAPTAPARRPPSACCSNFLLSDQRFGFRPRDGHSVNDSLAIRRPGRLPARATWRSTPR